MNEKHVGSSIDDFLREQGIFEESEAAAIEEVTAWLKAQKKATKDERASDLSG